MRFGGCTVPSAFIGQEVPLSPKVWPLSLQPRLLSVAPSLWGVFEASLCPHFPRPPASGVPRCSHRGGPCAGSPSLCLLLRDIWLEPRGTRWGGGSSWWQKRGPGDKAEAAEAATNRIMPPLPPSQTGMCAALHTQFCTEYLCRMNQEVIARL